MKRSSLARIIAAQVRKLSDAEIYALTESSDRATRQIAMQVAHARAEQYAMEHS